MQTPEASLTLVRTLHAPAGEVFKAWTDPGLIQRWMSSPGQGTTRAEVDPRVGGRYRLETRSADGRVHVTTGVYRELEPGRRTTLHKLLDVYTKQSRWQPAIDLLNQLAKIEEDPQVRARTLYTAALILRDELKQPDEAASLLERSLDEAPDMTVAFEDLEALHKAAADWKALAQSYRRMIKRLPADAPPALQLGLWTRLGDVAIKRLRMTEPSPDALTRFLREARIQGRLEHPAIVPIHDLGVDADGRPFFTMKRLAGTTLAERIKGGDPRRLLRAFVDVCLAVELAHVRGVVHRDLKPSNVFLCNASDQSARTVKVLDFGISKVLEQGPVPVITTLLSVMGTPQYMSPEQVRSVRDVDAR